LTIPFKFVDANLGDGAGSVYIMFIAFAKEVQINGRVSVIICGIVNQTMTAPTKDAKNSNQYLPVDFFEVSMLSEICAKITGILEISKI
jgi:hypothetical protein